MTAMTKNAFEQTIAHGCAEAAANYARAIFAQLLDQTLAAEKDAAAKAASETVTPIAVV
jgi:hypothetical protein